MVLGFAAAVRYNLTKEKNARVEKYLSLQREDRLSELSEDEAEELAALKSTLK